MSCILQRPSVSFHYSQSPSSPSSSGGLVMNSPNSPSHEQEASERGAPLEHHFPGTAPHSMPVHGGHGDNSRRPSVLLSCDTSGAGLKDSDDGSDPGLKNEPFFPQQNSPVEYCAAKGEHLENGFKITNRFTFMEEMVAERPISVAERPISVAQARTADAFSLNLKLELENYVHAVESGEQFRKFRTGPVSPLSSLSCSTSSLLSLAPPTAGCPSRRHSFSATNQSAAECGPGFSGLFGPVAPPPTGPGTNSNSSYYRQRSHTYSSSPSKPHPYPLTKRTAGGWHNSQNDLHDRIGGLQIRPDEHESNPPPMDEDFDVNDRSCDVSRDVSRKGSIDDSKAADPLNFLFLGPFGKKRKMVHERKQSLEGTETGTLLHAAPMDDTSSQDTSISVLSPVGSDFGAHKEKVEDIVEEDEFEEPLAIEITYEETNEEPLNLCLGEEAETLERVGRLNLNCGSLYSSQSSLNSGMRSRAMSGGLASPPDGSGSVLRRQLLGLTESIGPTPPQYQTRDRSASMSVITLRNRLSVIQETRAALNPRRTLSPPPSGQKNGFLHPSNATSTLSINSSTSETSTSVSTGKKTLECQDCGKVFSQLRNYRYHRSRHEGTSQFACTCPVCHKQFNDRGYLSSHLKIHKNAKEYHCEFCEKSFNQRVAYNMHVRIHTGVKPHQCVKCDKAFSRRMLLKQHERTHTGERPYKCEICGKAFADRSNMLLHQRLHTGLRPFHCDVCGKSFSKNHHLKTHLNHHAGIKPYQCPKCNATFSQSSNMKTHFRKCTAVPVDENSGFVPGGADAKTVAVKAPGGGKTGSAPYPQSGFNFQQGFEDRPPKPILHPEAYRNFAESENSSSAAFQRLGMSERSRMTNPGFEAYRFPQHLRESSPSDPGFPPLSSSAPSSSFLVGQGHGGSVPPQGPLLFAPPDPTFRIHSAPQQQSHSSNFEPGTGSFEPRTGTFDPRTGRRGSYHVTYSESPLAGVQGHSQHIPIKLSPMQMQQHMSLQLEHSQQQHHLQQSLQHLRLSPQNLHVSAVVRGDEMRARANTWSTNGSVGVGKRKQPL